jgi:hypothetical protein
VVDEPREAARRHGPGQQQAVDALVEEPVQRGGLGLVGTLSVGDEDDVPAVARGALRTAQQRQVHRVREVRQQQAERP